MPDKTKKAIKTIKVHDMKPKKDAKGGALVKQPPPPPPGPH